MQEYCGLCHCGNQLVMRIMNTRENEKDKKSKIESWIVHGFCKKCEEVFVQGIFFQEEKPVEDRDYMINWIKKIIPK